MNASPNDRYQDDSARGAGHGSQTGAGSPRRPNSPGKPPTPAAANAPAQNPGGRSVGAQDSGDQNSGAQNSAGQNPGGSPAAPAADAWTIGRLLNWTAEYLGKHGADNPRLDAEVLLAHARDCQRIDLYTAFLEPASDELRDKFRALVKRRAEGTPVAYLVGRREFYSLMFRVTPDVLIPRPETEFLVVEALDRLAPRGASGEPAERAVAEVGVGSGAVAVTLAVHAPLARYTAIDVSPAALAIARENAATHGAAERIEFMESDLFERLAPERTFDLIVSNPPYVTEAEYAELPRDVKDYEPRVALVGGPTGVELIDRLARQAIGRLRPGGWLLMEISPMIETRVRELLDRLGAFEPALVRKDLANLPRIVMVKRRS